MDLLCVKFDNLIEFFEVLGMTSVPRSILADTVYICRAKSDKQKNQLRLMSRMCMFPSPPTFSMIRS